MSTDFLYGGKQIVAGGPFKPSGKNMPVDARTRVEVYADIESIPNPFIGMRITVLADETNNNKMTDYIVKSLKANASGFANTVINEVVRYVDYLGVSGGSSGGGSGEGLTSEQARQLQTAYEHSQSDHVQASDIPSLDGYATETFVTNKIAEASLSGGSGLTVEQTNQLSVAYTHSQSTHISQNDINNAINNTLASQGGNIYVGTTKPTDNNIVLWIDTTESGGSETETKTLQSISATYTQGSNVVYPSTSINSLKSNLVVKANYSDNSQQTVTDYTLSGTLSEGTSTITVTYKEKTTTFNVTVSAGSGEVISDNITTDNLLVWLDGENGDNSSTTWNDKSGNGNNATISGFGMNTENSGFYNNALNNKLATYNSCKVSVPANVSKTNGYTIEVLLNKNSQALSGYSISQMPSSGSANSFFFWDLSSGTLGSSGGLSYNISNSGLTHLTFVIEGSSTSTNNIKLYVNGEFNSEKLYNLNDNNFETITLFNRETTDRAWSGSIYMFRTYSKPLTAEEITVNYNYENNKGRA